MDLYYSAEIHNCSNMMDFDHTFIRNHPIFHNMKDFSPGKRRQFGGRNSERSGSRFERRDSEREDRGENRFHRKDEDRGEKKFNSRGNDRFSPRFEGREEGKKFERHTVTCDACGKKCEVPFKPTSSKPVYCSDCFKKHDRFAPAANAQQAQVSSEEFNRIHIKLDKIMRALNVK